MTRVDPFGLGVSYDSLLRVATSVPAPLAVSQDNVDWAVLRSRARQAIHEQQERLGPERATAVLTAQFAHFDWRGSSLVGLPEFVLAAQRVSSFPASPNDDGYRSIRDQISLRCGRLLEPWLVRSEAYCVLCPE